MDSATLGHLGTAFEAMLLERCLSPLVKEDDALASFGVNALAQTIAERDSHGFGALLASRLRDRG